MESDLPYLVAGDFNDISSQSEKWDLHSHPSSLIEGFNQALSDCNLFDLGMKGRLYTWGRARGMQEWVEMKLDSAVAGADWCMMHGHATDYNISVVSSDHSTQRRHFLFENGWLKEVVAAAW